MSLNTRNVPSGTSHSLTEQPIGRAAAEPEEALRSCRKLLPAVSRTFAFVIANLPPSLEPSVTVAYLLCRLGDTVEDEVERDASGRGELLIQLAQIATLQPGAMMAAERFAHDVSGSLRLGTPAGESQLIACTPDVITALAQLPSEERAAISVCISEMFSGMAAIAERIEGRNSLGLLDTGEMFEYCQYGAGTVGSRVTDLV